MLEVVNIAGCNRGSTRAGDGGYHCVELRDWAALRLSTANDHCERARRLLVEGKDSSLEFIRKQFLDRSMSACSPFTRRHHCHSVKHFSLRDRCDKHLHRLLSREPVEDNAGWRRFESFGEYVRVEHDHFVNCGGCRTGSREGSASSTPPSESICRRIDSAKFKVRRGSGLSPDLRISRASSSMDLPWWAARTRSRDLSASSSLLIVMLAIHQR